MNVSQRASLGSVSDEDPQNVINNTLRSHDSTVSKNPRENDAKKISYKQSSSNNQNASCKTELLPRFLIEFWNTSLFVLIWNISYF